MTNKIISRLLSRASVILVVAIGTVQLVGCDLGECDPANCPQGLNSDISVTVISQDVSFPANISVLYKVIATDGSPIGRLDSTNFSIRDNGTPESQFESASKVIGQEGEFKTSVVLVLDLSGSITSSENLAPLKSASIAFLDTALEVDRTEVGIWWFDGEAALKQLVGFSEDDSLLTAAIQGLNADMSNDASTNLYGAIEQSVSVLENHLSQVDPDIASIGAIALFTDGTDQASRSTQSNALQAVNNADARINMYSIGLRGEIDENFLNSVGKDGTVFASNINDITPKFREIAERISDQANSVYELDYCSPRRSGSGHTLELTVRVGNRAGQATTTYSAEGFSGGCTVD